jgi:hypothetical protein
VLSINVYLETFAFGVFRLGYSWFGPTEARLGLIGLNAVLALGAGLDFTVAHTGFTAFDVFGLAAVAVMSVMLAIRAAANLRALASLEPSARERPALG